MIRDRENHDFTLQSQQASHFYPNYRVRKDENPLRPTIFSMLIRRVPANCLHITRVPYYNDQEKSVRRTQPREELRGTTVEVFNFSYSCKD